MIKKLMDFMKINTDEELEELEDDTEEYEEEDEVEEDDSEEEEVPAKKSKGFILGWRSKKSEEEDEEEEETKTETKTTSYMDRSSVSNIVPMNPTDASDIIVFKPRQFNQVKHITDTLRQGKTILLNMAAQETKTADAQRIMDFIWGACYVSDYCLTLVAPDVFLITPRDIGVSGDDISKIIKDGVVSPYVNE